MDIRFHRLFVDLSTTHPIMSRLTAKDFSFKCPMSWDAMEDSANGKFCSKCRKEVFDLTNCSTDEIHVLQAKHGSICGSVRVAQAAVVALSLSAAACEKAGRTTGEICPPLSQNSSNADTTTTPDDEPRLMGEICPPPKKPEKEEPVIDPFEEGVPNAPRLMGKVCPMPLPKQPGAPAGPVIDI
jgi:hypothetical protein